MNRKLPNKFLSQKDASQAFSGDKKVWRNSEFRITINQSVTEIVPDYCAKINPPANFPRLFVMRVSLELSLLPKYKFTFQPKAIKRTLNIYS